MPSVRDVRAPRRALLNETAEKQNIHDVLVSRISQHGSDAGELVRS